MKKQDYILFAIIIIAFIIWMYIVQKYFTVSYDELTIEEKIRYEQFMLPWNESERMSHADYLEDCADYYDFYGNDCDEECEDCEYRYECECCQV